MRVYEITQEEKDEALKIGMRRRNFHKQFGNKNHWTDPKKGEYGDEYYGALGEVLFYNSALRADLGGVLTRAPAFSEDPRSMPDWDFKLNGKEIEVKTVPPNGKTEEGRDIIRCRMLVKECEFKKVDLYVCVKLVDEDHYYFPGYATGDQVAEAPLGNFGFKDCYYIPIDQLTPMELFRTEAELDPFEDYLKELENFAASPEAPSAHLYFCQGRKK